MLVCLSLLTPIQVLRALAALDVSEGEDSMSVLVRHGLVPTVSAMLAALGPISNRRSDRDTPPLPPLSDRLAIDAYLAEQPYKGYRSDLVAGRLLLHFILQVWRQCYRCCHCADSLTVTQCLQMLHIDVQTFSTKWRTWGV